MLIYKILRAEEWRAFRAAGRTAGAPVDLADGYIHFSTAEQVVETAAKHFAGAADLWLLAVDTGALAEPLRWEPSRGGALFPHLYGVLDLAAVAWARPLPLHDGAHLFPEAVAGHVDPTRPRFDAFKALDRDAPVEMLNLLRFRARAAYPADHADAGGALSGAEAYARYGRDSAPVLSRVGGAVIWRGQPEALLVGPEGEAWDAAFVARYPSAHAFLDMVTDPAYRAAVIHRQAAVRTARLIRCAPEPAGGGFA